jgi:hypothetical protein
LGRLFDGCAGHSDNGEPSIIAASALRSKARHEFLGGVYTADNYSIFQWTGVPFDCSHIFQATGYHPSLGPSGHILDLNILPRSGDPIRYPGTCVSLYFQLYLLPPVQLLCTYNMPSLTTACFGLSTIIKYEYLLLAALLIPHISYPYNGQCLHCVYFGCRFRILGCNSTVYIAVKTLHIKIILKFF